MNPQRPPTRSFLAPVGQEPAKCVNEGPPQHSRPTKALLIGINYEGTAAQLKGCQNDAVDMQELLTRQYGFNPQQIRVMLDGRGAEYPSRANIMAGARWLVEDARPGDCLFFHFSGHGAQQEDPNCAEEDCMDETILPADFTRAGQIIDDELFEVMIRRLPSGVKLTAVMDCCHSGTGLDLPFTYDGGGGGFMGFGGGGGAGRWVCDDNPCHSEGHVVLLSGCCDDQTSADVQSIYSKPRGAMTEAFVETLQENPCPTYPQLLSGLRNRLASHGHSQRPQLTSSQAFDVNAAFEVSGGVFPNKNPTVGRHQTKTKFPRRQWLNDDDPLDDMLTTMLIADAVGGGGGFFGFGGFGDGFSGGDQFMADGYSGGDFIPADGGGSESGLGDMFGGLGDFFGGDD